MRILARWTALLLAALVLAACPKPVAADRDSYVGIWRSSDDSVWLEITAGGMVHYRKRKEGSKVTINMPLDRFEGADFYAGWGGLSTRFHVSKPPFEHNDRWKMTVDGEILERIGRRVPGAGDTKRT